MTPLIILLIYVVSAAITWSWCRNDYIESRDDPEDDTCFMCMVLVPFMNSVIAIGIICSKTYKHFFGDRPVQDVFFNFKPKK